MGLVSGGPEMLSFRLTAGVGLIQSICNLMKVYFDVICKIRIKIKSIHLHVSIVRCGAVVK